MLPFNVTFKSAGSPIVTFFPNYNERKKIFKYWQERKLENLSDESHLSKNFDIELPERMVVAKQNGAGLEHGLHAVGALLVVDGRRVLAPHLPAVENGLEERRVADDGFRVVAELKDGPLVIERDDRFGEAVLEENGHGSKPGAAVLAPKDSRDQEVRIQPRGFSESVATRKCRLEDDVESGSDAGVVETEFNHSGEQKEKAADSALIKWKLVSQKLSNFSTI